MSDYVKYVDLYPTNVVRFKEVFPTYEDFLEKLGITQQEYPLSKEIYEYSELVFYKRNLVWDTLYEILGNYTLDWAEKYDKYSKQYSLEFDKADLTSVDDGSVNEKTTIAQTPEIANGETKAYPNNVATLERTSGREVDNESIMQKLNKTEIKKRLIHAIWGDYFTSFNIDDYLWQERECD